MERANSNSEFYKALKNSEVGDTHVFPLEDATAFIKRGRSRLTIRLHSSLFDVNLSIPTSSQSPVRKRHLRLVQPTT